MIIAKQNRKERHTTLAEFLQKPASKKKGLNEVASFFSIMIKSLGERNFLIFFFIENKEQMAGRLIQMSKKRVVCVLGGIMN